MPQDYSDYFVDRLAREAALNPVASGLAQGTKFDAVQQASDNKIAELTKLRDTQLKQKELGKDAWSNRLGLDIDSNTGRAVNTAASVVEGVVDIGKNIATSVPTLYGTALDAKIPDEAKAAYARLQQGVATPADNELLNNRLAGDTFEPRYPDLYQKQIAGGGETNLQRIQSFKDSIASADRIRKAMDVSSIVDKTKQNELQDELKTDFVANAMPKLSSGYDKFKEGKFADGAKDSLSGIADMFKTIGNAAVNNPQAAVELIFQNAPQLLMAAAGKAGMALTNLPYAIDAFEQGISEYQKANKGAVPPDSEMRSMAAWAASLAVAETVGDKIVLAPAAANKAARLVSGTTAKAATDIVETAATKGFKQTLANAVKSVERTIAAAGEGAAGEFVTESYQTAVEEKIKGNEASVEDVFVGGAVGAISGAGLSTGMHLVTPNKEKAEKAAKQTAIVATREEAVKASILSGNVDALTDPKKPNTYAPDRAIEILHRNSKVADTTPELKQANLEKANDIVAGLEKDQAASQVRYDMATGQASADAEFAVKHYTDLLAKTDPANTVKVDEYTAEIAAAQKDIAEAPVADAKVTEQFKNELSKANTRLEQAREVMTRFYTSSQDKLDVVKEAEAINTSADSTTGEARANVILNLSMASSAGLDTATAKSLADNPNNGLSELQRTYFRTFSEARVAENLAKSTDKVNENVLFGGKGFVGLTQYRQRVAQALAANNKAQADTALNMLSKFAVDHAAKADVVSQAWEQGPGTQTERAANGTWAVSTRKRTKEQLRKSGDLMVNADTLVIAIAAEANAVTKTLAELQAAYATKFSTKPATSVAATVGVSNVPNVPKAPAVSQSPGATKQAPEAAKNDGRTASGERSTTAEAEKVAANSVVAASESQSTENTSVDSKAAPLASTNSVRTEGQQQSTNETVADTAAATSTESVEQTPKVVEDTVRGLTVLRENKGKDQLKGSLLGSVYRSVNKVAAFLTQRQSKVTDDSDIRSVRPLVDLQNMLSRWKEDKDLPLAFFPEIDQFSDEQITALSTFADFANQWSDSIRRNLKQGSLPNSKGNVKNADQLFRDPVQDFFNEDGTVDENVVTAIAYSAWSWLVDSTMSPAVKDQESITAMHGLEESEQVSKAGKAVLSRMTAFEDTVTNSIGSKFVAVMGFKLKPDAPQDYLGKVEAAFGVHALQLLRRENLVKLVNIKGDVLNSYLPGMNIESIGVNKKTGEEQYATYTYVQVVRDNKTLKTVGAGKVIVESVVGSQSIVDKLFNPEHVAMEASLEPIPFQQQFAKRTNQTISAVQKAILKATQKQENRIIPDMWSALEVLGKEVILKAAGWKDLEGKDIQANNKEAVAAQNNNLENQTDGMVDLINANPIDQPYFANFEVWKNFRVGVTTRNMNLQTSKIHRFMFYRPEWQSTISLNDEAKVNSFLISVAQAMGYKIDQMPNADLLVEKFSNGELKDVVANELARKLAESIDTKTALDAVTKDAIAKLASGAEGMQTLQALVAYGRYLQAKDAKADKFTATMLVGVDGKTNGPILSQWALGAADTAQGLLNTLTRGGMYSVDSDVKNFNHWYKKNGSLDLYEDLARAILSSLSVNTPGLAAIETIVKDLLNRDSGKVTSAGRKIVKTPLTSFAFGSSVDTSIGNMQAAFVQAVFDRIEDLATGADKKLTKDALITSINKMFEMGGLAQSEMISMDLPVEGLMKWEIKPHQYEALTAAFDSVLGIPVKKAMKSYFKVFIKRRNAVNSMVSSSFAIYETIYKDLRETEIQRLLESGDIAFTVEKGVKVPLHDLTVEQESALREKVAAVLPQAHTAYTQGTDDLKSGLMMSKATRSIGGNPMHKVEVQLGEPITRDDGGQTIQIESQSTQRKEVSPGVAGLPYMMHSLDSFIMHMAMKGTESLNVHDEKANAFDKVEETAKQINNSTWQAMLKYSPTTQAYEMFERAIVNANALAQKGEVSDAALKSIKDLLGSLLTDAQLGTEPGKNLVAMALGNFKAQEFEANQIRLETLSQMGYIDQYTWENGEYEVTNADRAEALKMLADARDQGIGLDHTTVVVANELGILIKGIEPNPATQFDKAAPVKTPQNLSPLQQFLANKPITTAGELMAQLRKELTGTDRISQFYLQLLRLLNKTVRHDLSVELTLLNGKYGSYFYESPTNDEGIKLSGDNLVEASLHELTHAALARLIANEPKNPLVLELEQLRQKAAAYAKQENITGFEAALADVQEFITWGMTNEKFQRTVLSQISLESKTKGNALVDGMKLFIDKIVGLLFAGSTKTELEQATNGMTVLISNVSGLFNQVGTSGQSDASVNLSMAADPLGSLQSISTLDIHSALNVGATTPEFSAKLQDLLTSFVSKLQGPFSLYRYLAKQNQALTPLDVWLKAIDTGVAPFASSIQGAPIVASQQEEFAMEMVEATVREALARDGTTTKTAYRQLQKLYNEMRDTLKGTMPQAEYDYIFNAELNTEGQSDYLARFAAYGLAHESFNKRLQIATKINLFPKNKTVAETLRAIFEAIVDFFGDKITETYRGQQAGEKLSSLLNTLVDIEAKKLVTLARSDPAMGKYTVFEKFATASLTARMKTVRAVAKTDIIANSRFSGVRMAGQFMLLADPQKVEQVIQGMSTLRAKHWKGKLGFVAGTLNFTLGAKKIYEALLRERKKLEGDRKDIITNTANLALEMFADKGKQFLKDGSLPDSLSASITNVFLRTGLHVLTPQYDLTQIEGILKSKAALQKAIDAAENQLNGFGRFKNDFINKANALGYYKATGKSSIEFMLMNAHNIAYLQGSPYKGKLSEAQSAQAEKVVEQLIALYALDYTAPAVVAKAQNVLHAENARTDGNNGISFILALQERLNAESKARNFHDNATLMVHGFTSEIYSPYVEVKTVTLAEGKLLEEQGYKRQGKVSLDPADPDKTAKYLYALNDAGLTRFLTGVVAYNGLTAKGENSKAHNNYMNVNTADGLLNASKQSDIAHAKNNGLYSGPRQDLTKVKQSYMAPVLNDRGEVVNFRYLMNDTTKDTVLKRDSRFHTVLGVHAGSIFDKETVAETNAKAMQALKEQYDSDLERGKTSMGYSFIGPTSSDKEDRETWAMLPPETKAEVRKIWGEEGMYVHDNARDIIFGYRKLSLTNAISKTEERREWEAMGMTMPKGSWDDQLEVITARLFTEMVEHFYGKRGAAIVRRNERVWTELVAEGKDLIVVKSMTTLLGNVKSNFSLLILSGVPPWEILKHHLTAWRGATSYERDSKELSRLQTLLDTKQTNGKESEIKQQVVKLKDSIARNPVNILIDNGLMPSIVEDTTAEDDVYSYKSLLARKVSTVSDKMPGVVVGAAKFMYMAKDTKMYQTLRHLTQLSDFMARYTQYQHLTTRRTNQLSKEDAIQQASDDFINYDIPMHRTMQYLDDTGIFAFSKYYLRIQKVLSRMFKENTARMLGALLLQNYMSLGPIVLDGSWLHKLGNNPLNWGALNYPGSLDELATVKAAMALIK